MQAHQRGGAAGGAVLLAGVRRGEGVHEALVIDVERRAGGAEGLGEQRGRRERRAEEKERKQRGGFHGETVQREFGAQRSMQSITQSCERKVPKKIRKHLSPTDKG